GPHVSDESLFGSPSAPTRSSDLLRFWGEDPIGGGDRIAKQFWGDIFAKLLHISRWIIAAPSTMNVRQVSTNLSVRETRVSSLRPCLYLIALAFGLFLFGLGSRD